MIANMMINSIIIIVWICLQYAVLVDSRSGQGQQGHATTAMSLLSKYLPVEDCSLTSHSTTNSSLHFGRTKGSKKDLYCEDCIGQVKIYRPEVFAALRQQAGLTSDHYHTHLDVDTLQSIQSDSKSGQIFLKSSDESLIIKTIKHYECVNLRRVLDIYLQHVQGAETCLNNLVGLYRIKLGYFHTYYILVSKSVFFTMNNTPMLTFPKRALLKFDLKGSLIGRQKSAASDVWKDKDVLKRGDNFALQHKDILLRALQRDITFLSDLQFMDYSLLVGVEEDESAASDPQLVAAAGDRSIAAGRGSTWPVKMYGSSAVMHEQLRGKLVLLGKDGKRRYHFGIIDFLQKYTFRKWIETQVKGIFTDNSQISCVEPKFYAKRMLAFIDKISSS